MTQRPVAYLLKVFPRLSETFILAEILELERQGTPVRIFSLRPGEQALHADVGRVRASVTYVPQATLSQAGPLAAAHLRCLLGSPRFYVRRLWHALRKGRAASFRHFLQAGFVAASLGREGIQHVHAHFASMSASVALHVHRLTGISYSVTAHAKDIYHEDVAASDLARKLRPASFAVTVSDFNHRHLTPLVGDTQLVRIYNGVDLERFPFAQPRTQDPPLVLAVGRLVEKKGFLDLIDACALVRLRGCAFRCLIVGSGTLEGELQNRIKTLAIDEVVQLPGPMSRDTLIELYRQASVVVAPCVVAQDGDRDGLPTVLIEAMALGVPVISTDVTGIPELVEHERTGLLVAQHDPEALADAVARILDDQHGAARRALAARARVEESFDLSRNVRRLRGLFASVAPG